jgi:DNA polymerase-3 subunit delta'
MVRDPAEEQSNIHSPRRRSSLKGHQAAESRLLQSYASGKMHHGWLLAGPRGIGKATLAFRLARFVLQNPDPQQLAGKTSLYVPGEAPVAHRVASGGHADLLVLERPWDEKNKRFKAEISAEGAREVANFFAHTAGEGGWRICIVDAADDLNSQSANALLKTLEEPPPRSLFILVSHQPGGLLPTIRSRCIRLDLQPLSIEDTIAVLQDVAEGSSHEEITRAAKLSEGSPGRALDLLGSSGAAAFVKLMEIVASNGRLDLASRVRAADQFSGRGTGEEFDVFCALLQDWMAREARNRAIDGRGDFLARAHEQTSHSIRLTNALNLDRRQTVLDALDALEAALRAA